MSISLFKTLLAVADTGSFRAAAGVRFVTDAAVGQQMRRLEDQLGVKLFDRSEKAPRLNQLGKAFVPKARAVVEAYETILDDLTGDPKMIGELVLGAVPSTIRGVIPKSARGLVEQYPDLHIRVVPGLSEVLQEQVESGTLDAAVISQPPRIHDRVLWTPFVTEELVLLTAPEVEESDPEKILASMPYLRHTRQAGVGMLADEWLSKSRLKVMDAMEMGSIEDLASMIAHNLGVTVGPNICVPDPVFAGLRKIPLGPDAPSRTLGVLTRTDCSKLLLVEKLIRQLRTVVAEHGADVVPGQDGALFRD